ncbi:MAG: Asp-tRNA(Asn)/Glu-tRNA(Gln) amidotransferase subunit GatB [Spirochaetia bacterium]|nr:Asp-tRNA(Asn)/Glu-tRNA(Gln) amidotransferase subunit GatB [Spirochaetia bacterium]
MAWDIVIGLEVHVQLGTRTKLFSSDPYGFGAPANSQAGPVTLGLPGVLPVLNEEVLRLAVTAGLALECKIAEITKFDRKHYFYPDLPKGYQISQYDQPYARDGRVAFQRKGDAGETVIRIHRIHMEEDAGKLLHAVNNRSYVDLNRAGVPLLEIVSEPDLRSSSDAYDYLQTLRNILRSARVSECSMEQGSLRCDANVSVRPTPSDPFGTRVEIKNLNSFKAVKAAIDYEAVRQQDLIESGGRVIQSTVLWDADQRVTRLMRTKEDAEDYRYFPDPDLLPFRIEPAFVSNLQKSMPELPAAKRSRYVREYGLPDYDADVLTRDLDVATYYEKVVSICGDGKKSSNWVKDEVLGVTNKSDIPISAFACTPERLGRMIQLVNEGKLTGKMAKQVFEHIHQENLDPDRIIEKYGYKPVDVSSLPDIINKVLDANASAVEDILAGKDRARGFIMGQIMKETRGQAPAQEVNQLLDQILAARKG